MMAAGGGKDSIRSNALFASIPMRSLNGGLAPGSVGFLTNRSGTSACPLCSSLGFHLNCKPEDEHDRRAEIPDMLVGNLTLSGAQA